MRDERRVVQVLIVGELGDLAARLLCPMCGSAWTALVGRVRCDICGIALGAGGISRPGLPGRPRGREADGRSAGSRGPEGSPEGTRSA